MKMFKNRYVLKMLILGLLAKENFCQAPDEVATSVCQDESSLVNEKTEDTHEIDAGIGSLTIDTTNICTSKISPSISIDLVGNDNAATVPIKVFLGF